MNIPKPYFENIEGLGTFEVEDIILSCSYPVIFTCKDNMNRLFLCICCDTRKEQRWIISRTNAATLIDMLSDKITIGEAFKGQYDEYYVVSWSFASKEEVSRRVSFDEIDKLDLPDEGAYMEVEENEFDEYIYKLRNE